MAAIGVDHVQFSVPDLAAGTALLEARGWRLAFQEPGFAAGARPYFRGADKSMAYLKRGRAAIELIDGSGTAGPGHWLPLFQGRLPGEARASEERRGTMRVGVEALGGDCLCRGEGDELELGEVVLRSSAPEASAALLESLGFRREDDGDGLRLAFPPSILGMGLTVTVVPGPTTDSDVFVDDLGPCLVALLAKDLEEERDALRAAGHGTTDVFHYTINGRPISNVVVTGPGGELVELIQIGRSV